MKKNIFHSTTGGLCTGDEFAASIKDLLQSHVTHLKEDSYTSDRQTDWREALRQTEAAMPDMRIVPNSETVQHAIDYGVKTGAITDIEFEEVLS